MAVSSNGRIFAQAIDNGAILVYDTEFFQLIRIYEGDKSQNYISLQFSSDNFS
jgi:WD40 repeat protein